MKRENPDKLYFCNCSLCEYLGLDWIVKQYKEFKDILIEDKNSKLIFDPFSEPVTR